ncbi:MAG: hypothetical protein R3E97_11155 [Candidatus Eisenbacteria bacterium]
MTSSTTQETRKLTAEERELAALMERYRRDHATPLGRSAGSLASVAEFDAMFPESYWTTYLDTLPSNEHGKLAWDASRRFEGLITLYAETRDLSYLELCWRFSREAMDWRDDRRGLTDAKGKSNPVWGSSKYNPGVRTHFLVHTGLILEPILETLLALEGRIAMVTGKSAGHTADAGSVNDVQDGIPLDVEWAPAEERAEMLALCVESLRFFDRSYRQGYDEREGYYMDDGSMTDAQPFNCQNVFAYDWILAAELTGDESLRERGTALLEFFRARIVATPEGGYIWEYAPRRPRKLRPGESRPEESVGQCAEISHGAVTVGPLPKLAHMGVVFGRADIEALGNTVSRQIYRADLGIFSTRVGCRVQYTPNYLPRIASWLAVTEYDPEAYRLIERYILDYIDEPDPLAMAYLVRNRP